MAYTSASTALNQKLSEKVKHKDPKKEEPRIIIALELEIELFFKTIFFQIIVVVKNKKNIVNALAKTDIILTINAMFSGSKAKEEKKAPNI